MGPFFIVTMLSPSRRSIFIGDRINTLERVARFDDLKPNSDLAYHNAGLEEMVYVINDSENVIDYILSMVAGRKEKTKGAKGTEFHLPPQRSPLHTPACQSPACLPVPIRADLSTRVPG